MKPILKNIQTEVDASFLYHLLSEKEENQTLAEIYLEMSKIELSHAKSFLEKHKISTLPEPSLRAKILKKLSDVFGSRIILDTLLSLEQNISLNVVNFKSKNNIPTRTTDTNHVVLLKNILSKSENFETEFITKFEKKHKNVGGNAIRAAVLGANDGLVSNFSLVMGIAGAVAKEESIIVTGLAGLLAGALSMALGEWISVKSSQELYENQIQLELDELEIDPEGEKQELILIQKAKGMSEIHAKEFVENLMQNKEKTHDFLVKEELGINTEELKGSAIEAAIYSFVFFAIGAIIPVLPFMLFKTETDFYISIVISAFGLFFIGASITLFTGKNIWYSGFRQVLFGLLAAAISFVIGSLIGIKV